MKQRVQEKSALEIKTVLLHQGVSIADLARQISRPRSTVSQAIHQFPRFPKVRAQVERFLCH
jgi:IS30 family transposase